MSKKEGHVSGSTLMMVLAVAVILIVSVYARWVDLGVHFVQVDDIRVVERVLYPGALVGADPSLFMERVRERSPWLFDLFAHLEESGMLEPALSTLDLLYPYVVVPATLTFAPLQFLATKTLLSPGQSYQELLFYGRLPSFFLGCASLGLLILFYRKFRPKQWLSYLLPALVLLGFSLENIIFSKQATSYEAGIFSLLLLFLLFLYYLDLPAITSRLMGVLGLSLGLLVSMHYQILFFLPAFFVVLLLSHYKKMGEKKLMLRYILVASGWFLVLFVPLFFLFLRHHVGAGISMEMNDGMGSHAGLAFSWPSHLSIQEALQHGGRFLLESWPVVIQDMTAIVPQTSVLYWPFFLFISFLIVVGLVRLLVSGGRQRGLGLFFLLTWVVWMVLVLLGKITLSPAAHSLILLPIFAILASEGFALLGEGFALVIESPGQFGQDFLFVRGGGTLLFVIASFTFFLFHFEAFKNERRDPFDPVEIKRILDQHEVDSIILHDCVYNPVLMKEINESLPIFYGCGRGWKSNHFAASHETVGQKVALIGKWGDLSEPWFQSVVQKSNAVTKKPVFGVFKEYDLLRVRHIPSQAHIEYSHQNRSEQSGLWIYVASRKMEQP